jgi:hypothetical protein
MATRLASKSATTTRLPTAAVSYSIRQPKQASSAAMMVDRISSIADAARPSFAADYLFLPFSVEPGCLADYRRCLMSIKPSRRSLNGSIVATPSLRVGSREVSYPQIYRFNCLYRRLFSINFIYRCRYQ